MPRPTSASCALEITCSHPLPHWPLAGQYYLRTRAAADAIKFTVDQQALQLRKSERLSKSGSGAGLSSAELLAAKENTASPAPRAAAKKAAAVNVDEQMERERQMAAMVCRYGRRGVRLMGRSVRGVDRAGRCHAACELVAASVGRAR